VLNFNTGMRETSRWFSKRAVGEALGLGAPKFTFLTTSPFFSL